MSPPLPVENLEQLKECLAPKGIKFDDDELQRLATLVKNMNAMEKKIAIPSLVYDWLITLFVEQNDTVNNKTVIDCVTQEKEKILQFLAGDRGDETKEDYFSHLVNNMLRNMFLAVDNGDHYGNLYHTTNKEYQHSKYFLAVKNSNPEDMYPYAVLTWEAIPLVYITCIKQYGKSIYNNNLHENKMQCSGKSAGEAYVKVLVRDAIKASTAFGCHATAIFFSAFVHIDTSTKIGANCTKIPVTPFPAASINQTNPPIEVMSALPPTTPHRTPQKQRTSECLARQLDAISSIKTNKQFQENRLESAQKLREKELAIEEKRIDFEHKQKQQKAEHDFQLEQQVLNHEAEFQKIMMEVYRMNQHEFGSPPENAHKKDDIDAATSGEGTNLAAAFANVAIGNQSASNEESSQVGGGATTSKGGDGEAENTPRPPAQLKDDTDHDL